ncbi:Tetratricopeptide repeat protein 28 [Stylophora pistillata]|uniref:Tetratricopeptide repeat protein 28 n=1 Tax=Stylophora pistillata TaxID=50429 RepID=A0A2B4SBX6_STYPI|nr:Tetratricopeptide repeat protein 28 [Stylophora pistillata]
MAFLAAENENRKVEVLPQADFVVTWSLVKKKVDCEDVLRVLFIGLAVVSVLFQTYRHVKAIEILNECLNVLKIYASNFEIKGANALFGLIYHKLFYLYKFVGDCKNAIQIGGEAIQAYLLMGDVRHAAELLGIVGNEYQIAGEQVKAKERYDTAFRIFYLREVNQLEQFDMSDIERREHLNRMLLMETKADNKTGQGIILSQLGETASKAVEKLKEADANKELGMALTDLGRICDMLGEFQDAISSLQKSLEISLENGDKHEEVLNRRFLGDAHTSVGEYDKGKKCYDETLALSRIAGDKKGVALAYSGLRSFYRRKNKIAKAADYGEKAIEIYSDIGDLRLEGIENCELGDICSFTSRFEEAVKYHTRSLEIKRKTGDRKGEAQQYGNLGVVYQNLGDHCKGKHYHERALAINKETNHLVGQGVDYSNLGSVYQHRGESSRAYHYYRKALEINFRTRNQEAIAAGYCQLGICSQNEGKYEEAKKLRWTGLKIASRLGYRNMEATILCDLAKIYSVIGGSEKAMDSYKRAEVIFKEVGNSAKHAEVLANIGSVYQSDGDKLTAIKYLRGSLDIIKGIESQDVEASTSAILAATVYAVTQDLPNIRLYLKKSIKVFEKIREVLGESEDFKIGFADKHDAPYQLMIAILIKLGNTDLALSVVELVRARSLAELMVERYSAPPLPDLDSSQLIDFHHVVKDKNTPCISFCFVQGHLSCWTLKANPEITLREVKTDGLPLNIRPKETLRDDPPPSRKKAQKLNKAKTPATSRRSMKEVQMKNHSSVLYKDIIAPVVDLLEGSEIVVVLDRSPYRVSFSALMNEKDEFLGKKFRIRYTPSLTTLKLIQDSPEDDHSETGVLLVGDPDVGTPDRLPCAKEEVEMIGYILNVQPLTGKEATKEAVLQKIHSVSLIHIAAHGEEEKGNIALAPSNREKDDFLLTMVDISAVRLRAKLVVLSCCHSGKGHIKGEGVVGIARAFLGSGARSVLASLWAMDDEETMEFMKQFCEHLVDGKSASECLHETMKWMRKKPKYSEVKDWAPFVLIGDDLSFKFVY